MKSIVYDFDMSEELLSHNANDVGFIRESERTYFKKELNEITTQYKELFKVKEINIYLNSLEDITNIKSSCILFNIKWIREDKELFEYVKNMYWVFKKNLAENIDGKIEKNKNIFKKLILNIDKVRGDASKFIKEICKNIDIYKDEELFDIVLKRALFNWDLYPTSLDGILYNEKIKNKKTILSIMFKINNLKQNLSYINKIFCLEVEKEIITKEKELEKIVHIANDNGWIALETYTRLFQYPMIYKDEYLRDYLFDQILKGNAEDKQGISKFRVILEGLIEYSFQNNKRLLEILDKTKSWKVCYLLIRCFQDKNIIENEELLNLILSMPNFYCLEQLLLTYETENVNKNIKVLRKVANFSPNIEEMERERKKYGKCSNETEWLERVNNR